MAKFSFSRNEAKKLDDDVIAKAALAVRDVENGLIFVSLAARRAVSEECSRRVADIQMKHKHNFSDARDFAVKLYPDLFRLYACSRGVPDHIADITVQS